MLGGHALKVEPPQDGGALCLRFGAAGRVRCVCRADLGPASEDWKARAQWRTLPPPAGGPHVTLYAELELRQFICSDCGTLLEVEVARRDQASPATFVLDG